MAQAYYGSRISPNRTKTPEGYLILHSCPIGRIGWMQYMPQDFEGLEIPPIEGPVDVERTEDELFNPASIASFEGKPLTNGHPGAWLEPNNYSYYMKGVIKNVKRGTEDENDLMLADIIVYDPQTIRDIENGKTELSSGYDYDVYYHPTHDNKFMQKNIRGNHVALVEAGRAGHRVCAKDEQTKIKFEPKIKEEQRMSIKSSTIFGKMFKAFAKDAEPEELAEASRLISKQEAIGDIVVTPPTNPLAATPTPAIDEHDESEEEAFFAELVNVVKELKAEVAELKQRIQATATDVDPLAELEKSLGGGEEAKEDEPVVYDPSEEQAADVTLPKESKPAMATDSASVLKFIDSVKPILAKLPPEARRRASDQFAKDLRNQLGIVSNGSKQSYAKMATAPKRAADTASQAGKDDSSIGEELKRKYNPHYKNKNQ